MDSCVCSPYVGLIEPIAKHIVLAVVIFKMFNVIKYMTDVLYNYGIKIREVDLKNELAKAENAGKPRRGRPAKTTSDTKSARVTSKSPARQRKGTKKAVVDTPLDPAPVVEPEQTETTENGN